MRHPSDAPPGEPFYAVLHDLDAVPADLRPEFLTRVVSGLRHLPMAVHGYSLSEQQAEALCRRGVAVAQRLHLDLFRTLCRSVRRCLESVPPDDALTDLTWVNVVD